jgi:hypothetical protein
MSQSEANDDADKRAREAKLGGLEAEARAVEREAYAVEREAHAVEREAHALERETGGRPFLPDTLRDLMRATRLLLNLCENLEREIAGEVGKLLLAKLRNEIQAMRAAIERQTGAQGDTVERGRT